MTETDMSSAVIHELYQFSLGLMAGVSGAVVVYPIDSVKTRVQNQRSILPKGYHPNGVKPEMIYHGYRDCFQKVFKHYGIRGFYSGLGAVLVGVGPEKAIKLTINDYCRAQFASKDGKLPISLQLASGGLAGTAQTLFTNPLEIVKIRKQLDPKSSLSGTIRELGIGGLYKGVSSCILRDAAFSAIYFTTYANLKDSFRDANNHVSIQYTLLAGFLAGFPAALFTTPADVIKTRLQAKPEAGVTPYKGTVNAGVRIIAEEGFQGLWKGAGARCLRSPPQFAITLFVFEYLKRLDEPGFTKIKHRPIDDKHPLDGGLKHTTNALFEKIDQKFGLQLPKFEMSPTMLL